MQACTSFVLFALLSGGIYADFIEDCRWGRNDPNTCCSQGGPPFMANPKDCKSYVKCVGSGSVVVNCAEGLEWIAGGGLCFFPLTPGKCPQVVTSRGIAQREVSEDCLWGREDAETCCKTIPEGDSTHLANPKECSSFYLCKNNQPLLFPCLPGQVWSVTEKKCSKSDDTKKCPQVAIARGISQREVSEDCLWGRQDAETCCKTIPEGDSTHLANPKECSSFYLCKNNQPLLFPCLPGQVWSVTEKKCSKSDDTKKCPQVAIARGISQREVSEDCLWGRQDAETCCKTIPEGDSTHLANPKECSSFYLCKNNQPLLFPCLPGQVWSVTEKKCSKSDDTKKCPQVAITRGISQREVSEDCLWGRQDAETCCKTIPEGDSTHLANPKECSSFYLCKNNQPLLFPCLPGQVWSVTEKKCSKSDDTKKCEQVQ